MLELALVQDAPRPVAEIMETAPESAWIDVDPEQLVLIETSAGIITVMLSSQLAQDHAAQVRTLAREDFYQGLSFYRVIEGFVAQGGDATGSRPLGKAAETLEAEFEEPLPEGAVFTPLAVIDGYAARVGFLEGMPAGQDPTSGTTWLAHCTGAFAFGRNNERDSASTEFYITLQPQRYLDRNLTVVGTVLDGIAVVQAAPRGVSDTDPDTPDFPGRLMISGMDVVADLPEAERPGWQVMDTASATFSELVEARKARPSEFFYFRPGHVDLCQMPVPSRRTD